MISDKTLVALSQFADTLRAKGYDDVADEIDHLAEQASEKAQAGKKKKP